MVCLLVVVIDASRLTQEPAKIKGILEVILKNGTQPGEAAVVGGASHETGRAPCPPGSRFPQAVLPDCIGVYPVEKVIVLLEGKGESHSSDPSSVETKGSKLCEAWLPGGRWVSLQFCEISLVYM